MFEEVILRVIDVGFEYYGLLEYMFCFLLEDLYEEEIVVRWVFFLFFFVGNSEGNFEKNKNGCKREKKIFVLYG